MTTRRRTLAIVVDQLGLLLVLAGLILWFSLTTRRFFELPTFLSIARQVPPMIVIAVGMTFVLIIGGIDLSVGSVLGLCAAVCGILMHEHHLSLASAALIALAVGLFCGLLNGVVTVAWALPSFIVTLGMLEIARGFTYVLTHSESIHIGSPAGRFFDASLFGFSATFYVALFAVAVGQFVLSRTVFGRYMVAIGTNEEVVRLSGIDARPVKIAVFAIAGLLSALGAVMSFSHNEGANPNAGTGLELSVIAAVVVGGTSLMGGRGSVVSSFLGVLIIEVLSTGLAARGVSDERKRIITGCVIVLAAVLDYYRHRWTARGSQA